MGNMATSGSKFFIVDASQIVTGEPVHADDLLNFTYNWSLDDQILVLIDDQDNTTTRNFDVSQLPTTFLMDSNNIIVARWDGYASASQLAFALQGLVSDMGPHDFFGNPIPNGTHDIGAHEFSAGQQTKVYLAMIFN
jgi:hypothetical protein